VAVRSLAPGGLLPVWHVAPRRGRVQKGACPARQPFPTVRWPCGRWQLVVCYQCGV